MSSCLLLWRPEAAEDPEGPADERLLSGSQQLPGGAAERGGEGEAVCGSGQSRVPPVGESGDAGSREEVSDPCQLCKLHHLCFANMTLAIVDFVPPRRPKTLLGMRGSFPLISK